VFAARSATLARLSRWPRRIAALICLLFAAGTALAPSGPARTAAHRAAGHAAGLRPDEVAVPVPVSQPGLERLVRPGERVGVLAAPPAAGFGAAPARDSPGAVLVADHLRVLSLAAGDGAGLGADSAPTVVVAATRTEAIRLAAYAGSPMMLFVDGVP
jgi:hypothetical protein